MQGDLVMSGAATLVPAGQLKEGDVVTAEFEGMGSVEVAIVDSGAEAVAEVQATGAASGGLAEASPVDAAAATAAAETTMVITQTRSA